MKRLWLIFLTLCLQFHPQLLVVGSLILCCKRNTKTKCVFSSIHMSSYIVPNISITRESHKAKVGAVKARARGYRTSQCGAVAVGWTAPTDKLLICARPPHRTHHTQNITVCPRPLPKCSIMWWVHEPVFVRVSRSLRCPQQPMCVCTCKCSRVHVPLKNLD